MKVLVTGGAGFVGTNLIKRLISLGHQIISIDNYSTGLRSNHIEGVTYVDLDIKDIGNKSKFYWDKFAVVFHMAAIARIQPSFERPIEYFETNALGTIKIAELCASNNIPLVYAGSSSHHSGRYKNPYTFTKDIGEDIITMFQQVYGLKASTTRFYNVYGPYHLKEGAYCTVIGIWEKAMEDNNPLLVTGDGLKRRDFTHINDIVNALYLIDKKQAWGYTFELGTGANHSIREVAEMFEYDNIQHIADRPGEAQVTLCTDTLAKEVLGWEAKLKLQDYIQEFIKNVYTV